MHRKDYIPIGPDAFGDGGAFPEIHVVQYPLNMGKPGKKNNYLLCRILFNINLYKLFIYANI